MSETMELQEDALQCTAEDMDALRSKVNSLSEELAQTKQQLADAQTELATAQALKEEAVTCSLDLRKKVETLSHELNSLRGDSGKSVTEVGCQTDPTAAVPSAEGARTESTGPTDWTMEAGPSTATQSVADSVRAIAEATTSKTGFVLDKTSGMYYDYNSGYYYDQVNKLYYDPNTGIYYYFDEATSSYQFHSQVQLPASGQAEQLPRGTRRGGASGKKKERPRSEEARGGDDRRTDKVQDMDCQIIEMGEDNRHRHRKRREEDGSRNRSRRESEIDSQESRRAHREKRRRRDHGSWEDVGNEVEVATSERDHHRKKRMSSREQRRQHERESRSRRRKKSSKEGDRRKKDKDTEYVQGQQSPQAMDVILDGEIGSDDGAEFEDRERDGQQSGENLDNGDKVREQDTERRAEANQVLPTKSRKTKNPEEETQGRTNGRSPEIIRGSSESSTAKDDSQSGEEAQRSSKEEGSRERNHRVPSKSAEVGKKSRTNDHRKDQSHPEEQEEMSDGEIVDDVMIVEDGEEPIVLSSDEMEEGELSNSLSDISSSEGSSLESESESYEEDLEEVWVESDNSGCVEVLKVDYPPCIRVIVTKSDTLKPGSLYIVTCTGGTIGREGSSHVLLIQSVKVSKRQAQIVYNAEERQYMIIDLGSQNGTMLNGKALSEQRVVSEPHPLSHRDYLTIGGTTLRLHIHSGDETCEECEPGQVQALLALQQMNEASGGMSSSGKQNKETQRRKELRHLKKKFNLAKEDYMAHDPSLMNPAYTDRAGDRRRTIGSDNPYQPDDQPASVDRAIESSNLGHKLLSKMGWSEGQSLGKGDRGIKEPIQAVVHSRNAGLGSGIAQSMDQLPHTRKRNEKWDKARGRYNVISGKLHPGAAATTSGKKGQTWVQGMTQKPDASSDGGRMMDVVQLPLARQERGEKKQGASQEIVDIFDESTEAANMSSHHGDPSLFQLSGGQEKATGKPPKSKDQAQGDDLAEVQDSSEQKSDYERLFLGNEPEEENPDRNTDDKLVTESSDFKPEEGEQETEGDVGQNSEIADNTDLPEEEQLESTAEEHATAGNGIAKPVVVDSTSKSTPDGTETMQSSSSPNPHAVKEASHQHLDETGEKSSKTSNRNQGNPANSSAVEKSETLADQSVPEEAKQAGEKGKIQLKWNKGGKEKVVKNLVAFEESESEEEENGESAEKDKKTAEPENNRSQQRRGDRNSRRRGSGRPSRWSGTRSSSGK